MTYRLVACAVWVAASGCAGSDDSGGLTNTNPPHDAGAVRDSMAQGQTPDSGGTPNQDSGSGVPYDSGSPTNDDAPVGTYDFPCGTGNPCALTDVCCAMPGPTVTYVCVVPSTCPASDKIACDGPDECGGSTPICCGVDVPNGSGTFPSCTPKSLGTSCSSAAACQTHIGTTCSDTTTVQLCHDPSDCSDPNNNECCTFSTGGASLTFCTNQGTATVAGATCH